MEESALADDIEGMRRIDLVIIIAIVAAAVWLTTDRFQEVEPEPLTAILSGREPLHLVASNNTLYLNLKNTDDHPLVVPGQFCKRVPWTAAADIILQVEGAEQLSGRLVGMDLRYLHSHRAERR